MYVMDGCGTDMNWMSIISLDSLFVYMKINLCLNNILPSYLTSQTCSGFPSVRAAINSFDSSQWLNMNKSSEQSSCLDRSFAKTWPWSRLTEPFQSHSGSVMRSTA